MESPSIFRVCTLAKTSILNMVFFMWNHDVGSIDLRVSFAFALKMTVVQLHLQFATNSARAQFVESMKAPSIMQTTIHNPTRCRWRNPPNLFLVPIGGRSTQIGESPGALTSFLSTIKKCRCLSAWFGTCRTKDGIYGKFSLTQSSFLWFSLLYFVRIVACKGKLPRSYK
jgi:hypothetical protein